jgi:hypothetical protein
MPRIGKILSSWAEGVGGLNFTDEGAEFGWNAVRDLAQIGHLD